MKPEHARKWQRVVGQMEEGCAMLAGIMAGLGLWSWSAGFEDLLSFGSVFVPMAPSTALVMMAFSLAVFLVHRWPGHGTVVRLAWWAAGLTAFVGLWAAIRPWLGWDSPVEQWLARTPRRIDHIPLGQMSPLTGVTFLAAALALGLRLLPPARFPKVRTPIAILALAVVAMGLGVTGSYAAGRPGLIGGSAIPMALWTALAFLCLGFGLWGFAAVEPPPAAKDLVARNRGLGPAQLAITSCLVVLICLVGALHLRHTLHESVANAGDLLQAIADLKTTEVVKWRQRCLREAEFLERASFVGQHVRDYVANPADTAARSRLRALFSLLQRGERFAAVAFLDTNAVPHLVVPEATVAESPFHRQLVIDASRSNSIVMSDLHRDGEGNPIYLDLAVPVRAPDEATVPSLPIGTSQSLGVLLLHFDAGRFLYSLVRTWPIPSSTAETVLVRREEGELIFLNEVRHRGGAAVNLRLPLSENPQSPSVRAVLGETGVVEGVDYRGARVLAAIRAIPGTPWFIATKMDREEVFAFLYEQAWLTLALTVVLAAAAGMIVNLVGQHRKVADMRRELALAQRVEHLMKNANDAILLADADWRIVDANDRAAETYGYTQAELRDLGLADLRAPEGLVEHDRNIKQLMATGHAVFETVHRRKDGSVFPVESSARVIDIGGVSYRLAMLRDISERKAQEREIDRMNRLYHTLSEINQSIVRLQTREELFHRVCQITAEFAGFNVVWLGWLDPETREVRPVGRAGARQEYLDNIKVYADGRLEGEGPVGTCIREGRACSIQDLAHDPRTAPCLAAMAVHGLRSALAVPIRLEGQICGAFTVCSNEPNIFQEKEVALLEEAALDISFALDTLQHEFQRKRAEEALQESERRFRSLFDTMNELVVLHELVCDASGRPVDYRIVDCNPTFAAVTGIARERAVGALASQLYGTGEAPYLDVYARVTQTGQPIQFEAGFAPLEKHFRISAFSPGPGRFATVAADITGHKRAIEALRQAEEKYRGIFENSTIGIYQSTPEGRLLAVNPAFAAMHGYASPAECLAGIWDIARQLYVEPARRLELQRQLEEQGWVLRFENQAYRKDGSIMWSSASARAIRDPAGKAVLYEGFVEDITERKQLEAERLEFESQLRQQQKLESIGTLAGGVAHEINNPIMGVMNYAQLVADQAPPGSPVKEYAQEIIHETERVATIVRNLLQFARHERQTHSPARMQDIVEQTLSLIRAVMRHDQVTLQVEIPPNLPAFKCRSQQLQQVLMNLLTNARDALNDKYPGHHEDKVIKVSCWMFRVASQRWLRLTVEDHGDGIPASVCDRIFDPFFTTKERDRGTGLGLSISHSIVKEHHGQLRFETERGRFTRFHVELPVDNGWALEPDGAPQTKA